MPRERSLRERALGFLARREHTRAELRRKLAPQAGSPGELDALLDDLVRRKLLSEERFAEARAHVLSRKFGLPLTSSGKLSRTHAKAKFIAGDYTVRVAAE